MKELRRAVKAGLLEYEVRELRKDLQGAETHKETIGSQNREIVRLVAELRRLRDQKDAVKSLSGEGYRLRVALNVSEAQKDKLKARLTKLCATGATLSKLSSDEAAQLRTALRRSRRQKATITSFGKENARLRRTVRKLERRQASLEVQPAKLRAIRKALESELAGLRAVRKTLSKSLSIADAELRRALRRSRRQKATIKSLSRENARLHRGAKASWNRIQTLEAQLARLRATGAVLSKAFCRRIGWFKPDGGLKDMMARVTMLDMHRDGLIVLPPKQGRQNRPKPIVFGPDTEPPLFPTPTTLDEVRPLTLRPVVRGTREGNLWNEFIARYHYLGYRTLVGAQMRYAVHDRDGWPVAMLGFSTAAWKLAPRDTFIGWTPQLREKNLPLMVDNPRFLILPWINIPNLGSHILAIIRRRLPEDSTERYNTTPVLIETFVETPRYTGAVYRASGWIHVGATKRRGRYDRDKFYDKPRKDIWLRPLRRDWKRTHNR